MNKTKIIIHCILLAVGGFLVVYGEISYAGVYAVTSDFRAFAARVHDDPTAKHALGYNGEKKGTNFDFLLNKIQNLAQPWNRVIWAGMILCVLALLGIALEFAEERKKKVSSLGRSDLN